MKYKILNYLLLIILALNFFTIVEFYKIERKENLEVYILDIGQGDSMLIKTPNNHWGLIDGGPDSSVLAEVDDIISPFTDTLEFMIFTHADDDHIDGLNDLMRRYSVNYAFIHKVDKDTTTYNESKQLILDRKVRNFSLFDNNDFVVDGVTFDVIWPKLNTTPYSVDNVNNTSISVLISYNNFELISMGDLESTEELSAVSDITKENIDFLKISHHGSKTSTSKELLKKLNPKVALISAGKNNRFGHPTAEVLSNLANFGIKSLRTDIDGRIKISTDGSNTQVSTKEEYFLLEEI